MWFDILKKHEKYVEIYLQQKFLNFNLIKIL